MTADQPKLGRGTKSKSRATQVAVFVTVSAFLVDCSLMVLELSNGARLVDPGGRVLGDGVVWGGWDVMKAGAVAVLLGLVAVRLRSWVMLALGLFFAIVAVFDEVTLHARGGRFLAEILELGDFVGFLPAAEAEWGQLLVLGGSGLLGLLLIWLAPLRQHPHLRTPRRVLSALLLSLFFFAGLVDLIAASYPDTAFETVEEFGEHLVLTLAFGYTAGLFQLHRQRSLGRPRQRSAL